MAQAFPMKAAGKKIRLTQRFELALARLEAGRGMYNLLPTISTQALN